MLNEGIFAVAGLGVGTLFAVFILWAIIWKGFALWISAREGQKWWFVAMLIINLFGLLEIIYIFGFSDWGKQFFAKRKTKKTNEQ